jgi:hypothetical protein
LRRSRYWGKREGEERTGRRRKEAGHDGKRKERKNWGREKKVCQ